MSEDFNWWPETAEGSEANDDPQVVRDRLSDLISVVEAFLKRKATVGQLRQALKRAKGGVDARG